MPKSLKTPPSVWIKAFRRIVQQLENNPEIRRVAGPNLRSWKGVPGDKAPFEPTSSAPVVRLTPSPGGVDWYSADAQAGFLVVQVELAIQTLCVDDVADLWDLLVGALLPGGPALAGGVNFGLDLVALGAETGDIVFSMPAITPQINEDAEGVMWGSGAFRLRLIRPIGP